MNWLHIDLPLTPILVLHMIAGVIAVLAGFAAILARKGAPLHRVSGTVFFASMIAMCSSAVYMAVLKGQISNVMGGGVALYLVITSWLAAKTADGKLSGFEPIGALLGAVLCAVAFGIGLWALSGHREILGDGPLAAPFVAGSIIALAVLADISVVLRRGLGGAQRIARHLWRMSTALFIAVASFSIQGSKVLTRFAGERYVLMGLTLSVLAIMVFWLARVFFTKWYETAPARGRNQMLTSSSSSLEAGKLTGWRSWRMRS